MKRIAGTFVDTDWCEYLEIGKDTDYLYKKPSRHLRLDGAVDEVPRAALSGGSSAPPP